MNKWIRRVLKIGLFIFLMFLIVMVGVVLNKEYNFSAMDLPPLFLLLAFAVPLFLCYSKWSNKKIWRKSKP
jgi:hypothetical protein